MAGSSTTLSIVLKLIDEASGAMKGVANTFHTIDRGISESARNASQSFAIGMGAAVTALGGLGYAALKAAGDMEQTKVAFTTMLGSAEQADIFIRQLVQFAKTTPFTLAGLNDAAKQLLAYGIEQKDVLTDLKSLGDIAAGVGMDKLPNLIMAFGQVHAATKLTGMELRQFTEAGVPMLQALTDQLNATGGKIEVVGGTTKKTAKEIASLDKGTASLKTQLASAETQLVKQNNRLREMQSNMKKSGASGSAAFKNLKIDIQTTHDKISSLNAKLATNKGALEAIGPASAGVSQQIQYTVADVQKMVSEGKIGFDQVQQALSSLTGEGGRFNDLMEKQSHTLGGMISNLQDAWNIFLTGEGQKLLEWAKKFVEAAVYIVQNVLPVWIDKIQSLIDWFAKHKLAIYVVAGAIIGALVPAVWAAVVAFAALAIALAPYIIGGAIIGGVVFGIVWMVQHWDMLKQKVNEFMERHKLLTDLLAALLPSSALLVGIVQGIVWMAQNWERLKSAVQEVIDTFQLLMDVYNQLLELASKPINFVIKATGGGSATGIGKSLLSTAFHAVTPFASGGIVTSPTLALIGEAGPEAVVPLSGGGSRAGLGSINVYIQGGYYLDQQASRDFGNMIAKSLNQQLRLRSI